VQIGEREREWEKGEGGKRKRREGGGRESEIDREGNKKLYV
jgi:hypothetical protein